MKEGNPISFWKEIGCYEIEIEFAKYNDMVKFVPLASNMPFIICQVSQQCLEIIKYIIIDVNFIMEK